MGPDRPAERVVYSGPAFEIGTFETLPSQRCFEDTGPIERHIVVFPRTTVWIQHEGCEPFLSDPNNVCFYNRGQVYRRLKVDERGDRCEWFAARGDLLRELLSLHEPAAADRPEQPFRLHHGRSDAHSVGLERLVMRHLLEAEPVDELFVEEAACAILTRVFALACEAGAGESRAPAPRHAELATAARGVLSETYATALPLSELAARLRTSPFHLCRVFRQITGLTLHAYRGQLRLRSALERVPEENDLTSLALDLGYSSHSHFTAAFRQTFATTPRDWRLQASGPRLRELAERLA